MPTSCPYALGTTDDTGYFCMVDLAVQPGEDIRAADRGRPIDGPSAAISAAILVPLLAAQRRLAPLPAAHPR